ncbi:MAG TPA: cation transporter [Firmicutes bacterium]|nr:cation transporter [Bacillota bacterium]
MSLTDFLVRKFLGLDRASQPARQAGGPADVPGHPAGEPAAEPCRPDAEPGHSPGEPDIAITDFGGRAKVAFLEAWVSIIGNIGLSVLKFALGLALNSIALTADAVHTASDVITSVIVLVGFRAAQVPADEEHPYGHGRIEPIATLIIAILLVVVGFEFLTSSIGRVVHGALVQGSVSIAAILAATAVFKEWMARFSVALGKMIQAPALIADAWHHRTDAIATVMVAVAMVGTALGYHEIDAILGIGVSLLIMYTGYSLGRSSASTLIGERPSQSFVDEVSRLAGSVKGVKSLHKVTVHDYGVGRKVLSLHIQVDESLSVSKSHEIAHKVEQEIARNLHASVTVHVEPAPGSTSGSL